MKSPNLGVIFQLTELERAEGGDRKWEVHDVERQRGFRVTLSAEELRAQRDPATAALAEPGAQKPVGDVQGLGRVEGHGAA